ncbi:MAG TPA: asparagine synthase-related protein, partial [Pyrinomonadaceae bacterium]|nr:asparagine synthase-related protein [Pyrinomonadaceae bacterium]
ELTRTLDLRDDQTDVAIVMAAYLKWGANFLPKIIGDFALSLWNPATQSLLLARDAIGPRTLYYHQNEDRIIWTTDLASLLDLVGIPLEINDEYVAGFFTNFPEPGLTPYRDINGVPPANSVHVTRNSVRISRFWRLDPDHEIRYRSDAEYEEHFRHVFREAVRCRLRVDGPVWSELSGGMDSSSIVCMAHDIMKRGEAQATSLNTVSRVFDEASRSDERRYILPVEQQIGKSGLHLSEDKYRILAPLDPEYVPTIPSYVANIAAYCKAVNTAMRESGSRVLLSGLGGGELLLGDGDPFPELADLLVQLKFASLHRRLRTWSEALNKTYSHVLWTNVVLPLLPKSLQFARRRASSRILRFYNQDFIKRMHLRERMFGPADIFGFRRPGGRYQSTLFQYLPRQISSGFWQEFSDVQFSYPGTDRRLIEFLVAIPFEQRARPKEGKSILRRALRDLLPPELLYRTERRITIQSAAARAAVRERERIRETFSASRASAHGYLDSAAVLAACDPSKKQPHMFVISLMPFEYWLRSFEKRKGTRLKCVVQPASSSVSYLSELKQSVS